MKLTAKKTLALIDYLIRFSRSKVKVTARRRGGVDAGALKSIF